MSVVNALDRVVSWTRREICEDTKLKLPPDGDREECPNAEEYDYREVTPACFPLFMPTKEKLPPSVLSSIPSVVVRILKGEDNVTKGAGRLNLDMCFSTWNPGVYGKDILIPSEEKPGTFKVLPDEEAMGRFEIYSNGWRDVWNWVDKALRALESTTNMDGVVIDRAVPITYGPLQEQEGIPEFYPLWFAWIGFAVKIPLMRHDSELERFL